MRNLQCQRIFQAGNIVNSVKLHPNQQEVLVGDAAGKYNFVSVCKLVIKGGFSSESAMKFFQIPKSQKKIFQKLS